MRTDNEIFEFDKTKSISVLSDNGTYTKELNLVSWKKGEPKIDIRAWNGNKPLRGISLNLDESKALYEGLKAHFESEV